VLSKVADMANHERFPSDLLLDKTDSRFPSELKGKLASQVAELFGLALVVDQDGDGENDTSKRRQAAFFQARTYLIVKNAARYAEQFQGLYALMRGLGCSFFAGAVYLVGWVLAFHRNSTCLTVSMRILFAIGIAGSLVHAWVVRWQNSKSRQEQAKKSNWKRVDFRLALCLLVVLLCSGFWASAEQPNTFWSQAPNHAEYILLASASLALTAAAMCLSAYREFTVHFAQTVWRDFSAYLSFQPTPAQSGDDGSGED
jgi:hypothetical protein